MHPAPSVILFTTLSGLGFGMFTWLGLGVLPENVRAATTVIAFVMTSFGLAASTFHLGHPERAWRAFTQWRSSWLSREGVMAVITLAMVIAWWYLQYPRWLGALLAGGAMLTVFATAMIYAQLKSVRQWNTMLTPAVFVLMSLAGGALITACADAWAGALTRGDTIAAMLLLIVAWSLKVGWWRRAASDIELSDPASATGLGESGEVRLLESPHTGKNYLLKEMGFQVARKHTRKLRRIAVSAGGALPVLVLALSARLETGAVFLLLLAVLCHAVGVLAERWLFFAEARHAVMSYYE